MTSLGSVKERTCLVVGGAGFIGSHLVERLLDLGHRVHVVDDLSRGRLAHLAQARSQPGRLKVEHHDVAQEGTVGLISRISPTVIYHLCGPVDAEAAEDDPTEAVRMVLGPLVAVLEAARPLGAAKVVWASSVAAGVAPKRGDADLGSAPVTALGFAQELAHRCLLRYRDLYAVDFTDLRLANVYGPRQPLGDGAVIPALLRAAVTGEPFDLHGGGGQTRDFVYVDDVVEALCRCLERGGGLTLEVGSGQRTSIADLVATVERLGEAGEIPSVASPARRVQAGEALCDPRRAELYLGWHPFTALDDGLRRTLAWLADEHSDVSE